MPESRHACDPLRRSTLATLPAAAGLLLVVAPALPFEFRYQPNDVGIVSATTLARYPAQQEVFWFVFALAIGAVLTVAGTRVLPRLEPRASLALEVLGALVLLAAVLLASPADAVAVAGLLAMGAWVAWRARRGDPAQQWAAPREPEIAPLRAGAALGALAVALFFASRVTLAAGTPIPNGIWDAAANLLQRVPDSALVRGNWIFLAEWGQHLAWNDAFLRGGMQGRDFYCLYGPLYPLSLQPFWLLFGRSLASFGLWEATLHLLGAAGLLLLAVGLLERRWWIVALPLLVPQVHLRIGLGLFGLFCLTRWLLTKRTGWAAIAGVVAGIALAFSQEFGLAFGVVAALALALVGRPVPAVAFGGGFAGVVCGVLAGFASRGAATAMLSDLIAYPALLVSGFGNLPFAPLPSELPILPTGAASERFARLGHVAPLICAGALLLALPLARIDLRRPLGSLRELRADLLAAPLRLSIALVALFGLLSFRSALGRSDLLHLAATLAPAGVLACVAFDRTLSLWGRSPALRSLAAWRGAALVGLLSLGGMLAAGQPWLNLPRVRDGVVRLVSGAPEPSGDPRVLGIVAAVRRQTKPGDPVWFLLNDGALYYLTDTRNPTRFALAHQMVTDDHRAEALEDLRTDPPVMIVIDPLVWRVDKISDVAVLGPDLMAWIAKHYRPADRIHRFQVYRPRRIGEAADPS